MFVTLLLVSFLVSSVVSVLVALIFKSSISQIMKRIVDESISEAWTKYLFFAVIVTGVSGGIRIWDLERYISPDPSVQGKDVSSALLLVLNSDRWILELFRTVIGTLQSVAWMLLVFFLFALIAYVIVRATEIRKNH